MANKRKIILPYISGFTPFANNILKKNNFIPIIRAENELNSIIKLGKDVRPVKDTIASVYKINCLDCNRMYYIGQTYKVL